MKTQALLPVLLTAFIPAFVPLDETSLPLGKARPDPALSALAGSYYYGDGKGVNCRLTLTAEGTFSFQWRGCLGVYDSNEGTAKLVDGCLILKPTKPNQRKGFRGTATDFIPVSWGKPKSRIYLIPNGEEKEFCNSVNLGREPRNRVHGRHYLRDDDWKIKVDRAPEVPNEWKSWLLNAPIEGKILEVRAGGVAKINLGSKDGVWKGMGLYVDGAGFGFVVVKSVNSKSSIIGNKYHDLDTDMKPGLKVRSRVFANDD